MARPERFELPTAWFVARYSIQLSYGRVCETGSHYTERLAKWEGIEKEDILLFQLLPPVPGGSRTSRITRRGAARKKWKVSFCPLLMHGGDWSLLRNRLSHFPC